MSFDVTLPLPPFEVSDAINHTVGMGIQTVPGAHKILMNDMETLPLLDTRVILNPGSFSLTAQYP